MTASLLISIYCATFTNRWRNALNQMVDGYLTPVTVVSVLCYFYKPKDFLQQTFYYYSSPFFGCHPVEQTPLHALPHNQTHVNTPGKKDNSW